MVTTRETELRARSAAAIARIDAIPPYVAGTGEGWQLPEPQPAPPEPQRPERVAKQAPGVSYADFDGRFLALEQALGTVVRAERLGWMRRVAELERRIAELEGRTNA